MKFIYLVLSFLALTSCVSVYTPYKGTDAGYALISLTLDHEESLLGDDANFSFFMFNYAQDESKSGDYDFFSCSKGGFGMPSADVKDKNSQTFVIMKPLQPGKYRIFLFSLEAGGNTRVKVSNKNAFSIPFEIKPNEYSYLGNYHGIVTTKKALLFGETINGGYIVVSDHKDRDVKLAKSANPLLKIDVINNSVPDVELIGNPLFVRERQAISSN